MTREQQELARTLGLGKHRTRRRGWAIAAAGVVAAGLLAWALLPSGAPDDRAVYVTDTVARADFEVTISATGTVEPTDLVEVSSELSGTIDAVHVDFNDIVEVGTVLAELDTSRLEAQREVQRASLASAEARITLARASLREARADYERGLELRARGVESDRAFIAQEAAFDRAGADLAAAIAARDLAQANVDLVQVDLGKSCICSPVAGIVLDRAADEGQIVAASLSAPILFTIAEDLARMELRVDIDEADIGVVAVGQPAVFTVEAHDDRSFPAEISELRYAPETVDGVVTYKAILSLDNSDMALRPGMTATADIIVASVRDALVVPNAALRYAPPQAAEATGGSASGLLGVIMPNRAPGNGTGRASGNTVWVLRDGSPVEVAVETGASDGTVTAILAGDLAEGDQVIEDRIDAE